MSMPVPQMTKSAVMVPRGVCNSTPPSVCLRALDRRAFVQREIGVTRAAVISRLRKAFAHLEDLAHEAPAPGIVEIAEMAQEAAKGQPAIGLDHLDLSAAAEQMHFGGARLQRGRRIVEGGGAGADHRDALAAQAFEVDVVGNSCDRTCRQIAQGLGNHPVAHALLPRRQHDLARIERLDAIGASHARGEQTVGRRRNLQKLAAVAHGQTDRASQPEQIVRPMLSQDQVQLLPALLAETGFVPGLIGQAGDIEVRSGIVLRAAQRRHAGIGEPRALLPPPRPCRAAGCC